MNGKILNTIPVSGEFPEVHFGEHFNHRLWVEFEDNDYSKWIACFPKDYKQGLDKVLVDKNNDSAFVVSSGKGFLIDIDRKKLILETDDLPRITSVILTSLPDYFVVGTYDSVLVFDKDGLVREVTPSLIIDGIFFKGQEGNKGIGDLATAENQYDFNMGFEFDLNTYDFMLNQKVIRKNYGLFETVRVTEKDYKKGNIFKRLISKIMN